MKHIRLLDIKFSQIQIFLAAAELGSITKAAQYLNITQPTVSKNIKYLENSLGLYLFIRDKQTIRLTPAGRFLKEEFSSVYTNTQNALEKAHSLQTGSSLPITVGIPDSSNLDKIFLDTKKVLKKRKQFSNFHIECLSFQELSTRLLNGEIDIVITCGFNLPAYVQPKLQYYTVPAGTYYAYMRPEHPLASRESLAISALKPYPFLMVSPMSTPTYEQMVIDMCALAGFRPLAARYLESPNSFICNFDNGNEIFIADSYMRESENLQLKRIPIRNFNSTMAFVHRKANENPMIPYICKQIIQAWPGNLS